MKNAFLNSVALLTFTAFLFLTNNLHAQQLSRNHLSLPAGEMWGHVVHRTTPDNGMIAFFESFINNDYYLHLMKTSAAGVVEWSTEWDCDGPPDFNDIEITSDSGFILCYRSRLALYTVLRFNAAGAIVFSRYVDVTSPYYVSGTPPQVIAKSNGNCYIVGWLTDTTSYPYDHVQHVSELDGSGTVLWSRVYSRDQDYVKSFRIAADTCANGDLVLMGYHADPATAQVCPRITRITPTGTLVWSKYYSVAGASGIPVSMVVTEDDEIVVASEANTTAALLNLLRCDGQGNVLWNYEFTGSVPAPFHIAAGNGELMAAESKATVFWGFSPGTSLMLKTDFTGAAVCQALYPNMVMRSAGNMISGQRYSAMAPNLTAANFVYFTTDLCGQTCDNTNFSATRTELSTTVVSQLYDAPMPATDSYALYLPLQVTLSWQQICTGAVGIPESAQQQLSVYPVPANNQLSVTSASQIERVEIIDVRGAIVHAQTVNALSCSISTAAMAEGVYFLRVRDANGTHTLRTVIAR